MLVVAAQLESRDYVFKETVKYYPQIYDKIPFQSFMKLLKKGEPDRFNGKRDLNRKSPKTYNFIQLNTKYN